MKHLKLFEKYTHTQQDKIDDMKLINDFSEKFEDMFEYRLNINEHSEPNFRDYLGHGAEKNYTGSITKKLMTKNVEIKYIIFLTTDINPNGILSEKDIDRTFNIKFEIQNNNSRYVKQLNNFYGYSRKMDEILERFDYYVLNTLDIKRPTEEEIKQYKLEKTAKKYNL